MRRTQCRGGVALALWVCVFTCACVRVCIYVRLEESAAAATATRWMRSVAGSRRRERENVFVRSRRMRDTHVGSRSTAGSCDSFAENVINNNYNNNNNTGKNYQRFFFFQWYYYYLLCTTRAEPPRASVISTARIYPRRPPPRLLARNQGPNSRTLGPRR